MPLVPPRLWELFSTREQLPPTYLPSLPLHFLSPLIAPSPLLSTHWHACHIPERSSNDASCMRIQPPRILARADLFGCWPSMKSPGATWSAQDVTQCPRREDAWKRGTRRHSVQ